MQHSIRLSLSIAGSAALALAATPLTISTSTRLGYRWLHSNRS